ncbi:MAG: hypothetical protein KHX31_03115 [Akkermansia sp.]|uniref:ADP-ribosyltransferase-containing protein n=1 Tax=Akkermansia sp. TaxID=1872421 RepID=UPI0025BC6577|nr:hypothetical protein [Akkermansia sp.]MBS5507603.1 hypothetical protein [Akkermansia sp.]
MNDFSFSEGSLAEVPVQRPVEDVFAPQVSVEESSKDAVDLFHEELESQRLENVMEPQTPQLGLEDGGVESGMTAGVDAGMFEPSMEGDDFPEIPDIEGTTDFADALRVHGELADGPVKLALEKKMNGFRSRLMDRGFMDPAVKLELEQSAEKLARLDALAMDWKEHPEARQKAVEAYGEGWVKTFEQIPDERKDLARGSVLLETLFSRPGDKEGDARMRLFSSLDQEELNGIRDDADIWRQFARERSSIWKEREARKAALEKFSEELSPILTEYVKGGSPFLSPGQAKMIGEMGISWQSMKKARRGYEAIAGYVGSGRLYDDRAATMLAMAVGDDETARQMLLNILYNESKRAARGKYNQMKAEGDKSSSGLLESAIVRGKRAFEEPLSGWENTGEAEAASSTAARLPEKVASGLSLEEARREIEQDRAFLQIKRRWRTDLAQTMMTAEADYLNGPDRNALQHVSSLLGGIVGDTSTFLVPYGGILKTASLGRMAGVARLGGAASKFGVAGGASIQRRRDEGTMMGMDMLEVEQRAGLFGTADFLEEMIAFGALGRMVPGFERLTKWAGRGRPTTWRTRFASSPRAQLAAHTLMGVAEEGILEPTAGFLMRSAMNPLLSDERGKETFGNYMSSLKQMMDPEQLAALALFSGGMSSLNYGQLKRDSARFRDVLTAYKASGGTEAGLLDAMKQPDRKGVLKKAVENLHRDLLEDPQGAMERAKEAGREMLSGERILSLRELDTWKAAETAGMVPRVEPAEQEGMFRVYDPAQRGVVRWDEQGNPIQATEARQEGNSAAGKQQEGGKPSYTLMNEEQMMAYLQAFVSERMESDIVQAQHVLAGDVMVNQALAQKRFDAAEVITHTETDEKTGAERVVIAPETLGQMKARADMAMAAIRALEAEGVSYDEAAARIDPSLSEHIPLGSLVQTWDEAQERIRTEQASNPEFKTPAMDAPFSRAYVTNVRRGDTFRRVLRYARGSATVEDLMEETMEQAVISWQAEQNTTWREFGMMLQEAQRAINDLFPEARGKDMQFIHLDADKPVTGHDAIEAFSKIGRSRWLADAVNHPSLPSWLRKLLNHLVKFLGAFKVRVELGEMVRQAEEQGVFTLPVRQALAVMLNAGNALYREQQGDLIALTMERAKAQADLDAALGRGVATEQETVEEQLAERNAADEPGPVDRAQEEADDANAQHARRERTEAEVEMLGEQDDDGVFNGGVSIRIEDGVRQGFIDKDRLTLCPDVPQFKQGADEKTGVVNRIVGAWQRNAAPISVWRRTDGSLQVISGRHRLDACTDADINCTVYEEGDRFNLDWARRHDVENNIRDGQASAFEIARYVRDSSLSMTEAVERGIARKGASLKGVELGLYASQELLDALGNGLVSADDAYRVALAFRNDAEVQRSGLAVLLDGGSWQESYNTMAAKANLEAIARQNAANGMDMGMDLFGNTDNEELYKRIGKYAAEKYRELGKELTAINGASRNPKVARKYGVNVNDAAAVQQVVKRLQEERARWKNFAVHPDLLKEANDAVMVEMGLKSKDDVDRENGVLPLEDPEQEAESADQGTLMLSQDVSRMLDNFMNQSGTHFSLAGENEALLAPNGKPSNLAPEQYRQVRTPEFKNWFGDWEKVARFKAAVEKIMTMEPVASISGQEFQPDGRKLTEKVSEFWNEKYQGVAVHPEIGEVKLDVRGVKASIAHGIGGLKAAAFALVHDVIEQGVIVEHAPNWKGRGDDSFVIAAPVTIKGEEYICEVVVMHGETRIGFYLHEVQIKERLRDAFKTGVITGASGVPKSILMDVASRVKEIEEGMSKVVDENGEPRVVYHGTRGDFTVFNMEKAGSSNKYSKVGFWFSPVEGFGEHWLKNSWWGNGQEKVLSLFLNLRNPKVFESNKERYGDAFERLRTDVVSLIGMDAEFANIGGVGKAWYKETERGLAPEFMTSDEIDGVFHEYREKLKNEGYDGIFIKQTEYDYDIAGGVNDQYVAFDSAQVKSATDNRGTFGGKNPDITFSLVSAQEQGLFREGHFEADNAVITEPGVTFSIAALHASPHSFRKFSTDNMGKGEGAQAYGWGLYFAESEKVNRDYMNWFAQDNATWKFGDVETSDMEVMHQALADRLLPKDALPEVKEDASDMIWTVLGDLSDARGDEEKIEAIKKELREDIQHSMEYGRTYHQTLEKMVQLHGVYRSLIDLLDEIEVRPAMPSNYRVELNVDDSELLGWDYVDETILGLLKDSPVEEVRYALERAERRADDRGENVSGKDVYQELFDAFWDGEDGTRQEAQKAASVSLLSSDIKGIRYADGYTRGKAEEEQTYNYVIFNEKYIKITAFADESTGGAWADYEDPTATFSIIGEKAESFMDYHNNGLSYTDPADNKRKAIIDSRGVRLKKERISVSEGGHVNVSLAAALDFPELFRAYPELRKLRVDFYRDSKSNTGGFTDPQDNYIAVNLARGGKNAAPGMVLDTILHEVQHVIQGYEGFAVGAGNMSREQAMVYLDESMKQLMGRGDDWAKEALPRLERMKRKLEEGILQPAFVYIFSHGEQEARLAGSFNRNSEGVVMSGLNGFRLLDAPMFSIPLTGNITELGGITFGSGRFGRMADKILAPNGDWLYDEMVFKMRAATQRSVNKLNLYETGDRERGLELLAEAQELIATVERFLPNTYGFGLEPYKIWLNVFSLLYGNSGKMAPDEALSSALGAIPMEKWPEIMEGSVMKHFWAYVEQHETLGPVWEGKMKEFEEAKFAEAGEKAAELDKRRWEFFVANGAEFLEKYGQVKVYRLIGKFMERVVEQIDRYRKDRTLGRIRRVVASVAPRTNPKGKPMLGKMNAEAHRRLEKCMRLLEMTESQYDEFFQKNFPEDAEEGKRWEDLAPDALVQVTLPDAEGRLEEVAVTQREFETYACYERMDVNTAEKCGAALGEFISTSRHAWENAAEKKKLEIAAMAAPVLQATGELDDNRMAKFRRKARLRALPKKPLSLFDYLMNFNQYMQALSSVEPFAAIAHRFEERAARFNVQRQASEKDMLGFVHNTVAEIAGSADRYDIAEWIYEGRVKQDTGITVVEREPDWNKKANALYRERLLHLLRRKVKSHGLEAVQLYLREFKLSEDLKKEVNALFGHRRKEISAKQAEKALKHMESVFTQKEWERYGDQDVFVRERAEMLRSRTKYAKKGYQPKSYRLDALSRMEAAYLVLLSEQADYTDALAERGFDAAVMDQLREFAGDEVMRFAYQLREKLNERSGQVQEMTEKRYGTPFPLTENYFRAFFDVTMEAIDKSIADAASYGEAATGGKYGMIHSRRKHKAHLDLEMDVCTAFMAAMTEQDLYLYGSEISRDLRALLNFRGEAGEAGRSLEVLLGRDAVGKLMAWADAFDRAGAESIRGHLDMNRLMNRLSGAAARVLLSGRVGTLTKQVTTVINAMYASDEISLAEWLGAVRRYLAGKLVKPVSEIEALPELDSRDKTKISATLAAMGADEAGRRVSRLERWNREGMDLLERVDMKGNTISAAILYDAVYRKAKREAPDATEAELDAVAMAEVRRSLSRKGQPMTQLQKSLAAQHRTWMQVGMLFLAGESINTIGNVFSLARSGQWGKAGLMWVSHGMVLALLNGLLNFMTDDEKRRRKREWWHALFDVVMGPVMGIPVVSGLAGEGMRQLAKLCGYNAFMPGNNLLVPFSNAADIGKAFSNAWKVFDGKERPWEDDALSFHELLRTAAAGTVAFSPRTTKGGAAAVGAALTMAALLNVTEFALKTVRSVQENGVDLDKWRGK